MKKPVAIFILSFFLSVSFPLFAEQVCNFKGDLDFLSHVFNLEMAFKEKSALKTNLNFDNDKFSLEAKIQNLKLNNHVFSSELLGQGQVIYKDGNKLLKCFLESKYSLMDYKPFKDISADFTISRDSVVISELKWGNSVILGDMNLSEPREVNFYAEIHEADINEIAALIGLKQEDLVMSGTVDGFLRFKGPLSNVRINGQLKATNGTIEDLSYREIAVKIEGSYPVVNLFDCEIIEEDGVVYAFDGKINLAHINNLYSSENVINFSPLTNADELSWRKWTIRRNKERQNLEFEHRLKSGRSDTLRLRDEPSFDMLGVEQTLKF